MRDEDERILDEATDWLLVFANEPTHGETRARFQAWLRADHRHAETWRDLNESYDLIGEVEPAGHLSIDRSDVRRTLPLPRRSRSQSRWRARGPHRKIYKVAGVAALAAILMVWLVPDMLLRFRADHITGTGELRTIALEDGSTVQLGPDSAIRATFSDAQRKIELLSGEALFQVRHNPRRPFLVEADTITTTVLGTGFDVRRLRTVTQVGVQHGRVRVDIRGSRNRPTFLAAGDEVRIDLAGGVKTDHTAPALIASWALAEVNARDRTIAEVIDEIRPWYSGKIIMMDERLGARRVNGIYNPKDAAQAIRSLVGPGGGRVTQITPWLIIVSA